MDILEGAVPHTTKKIEAFFIFIFFSRTINQSFSYFFEVLLYASKLYLLRVPYRTEIMGQSTGIGFHAHDVTLLCVVDTQWNSLKDFSKYLQQACMVISKNVYALYVLTIAMIYIVTLLFKLIVLIWFLNLQMVIYVMQPTAFKMGVKLKLLPKTTIVKPTLS